MKTKIKYIIKDRFFVTKAKLFVEGINFDFSKFAISIFPVVSLPVNFYSVSLCWSAKNVSESFAGVILPEIAWL